MAHFAKIGLNNKVIAVVVVDNSKLLDSDNNEVEELGRQFLESSTGWPIWKQTSINTKGGKHYTDNTYETLTDTQDKALRANGATIGMYYDETNDIFKEAQPHSSWTLNTTTGEWNAPVTYPTVLDDGNDYPYIISWNESNQRWETRSSGSENVDLRWDPDTSNWVSI